MLEIGVQDRHGPSAGMVEAGSNGDFLAEVPAERHGPEPRIGAVEVSDHGQRIVGAAIVDEDHFPSAG